MNVRAVSRDALKTVAWGVVAIAFGYFMWGHLTGGDPLDQLALVRHGETAPGFIVDTWEEAGSGDEGGTQFVHGAEYEYHLPDGRVMSGTTGDLPGRLNDELYNSGEPVPIQVEYLPDQPDISRIKGEGRDTIWGWIIYEVGLSGFVLAVLLSPGIAVLRDGLRKALTDLKTPRAGQAHRSDP